LRDADAAKRLFRNALSDASHPQPLHARSCGTASIGGFRNHWERSEGGNIRRRSSISLLTLKTKIVS